MQELLEEFVFNCSFYKGSCSDLSSQARMTAVYEDDDLCCAALSRAAEKLDMGEASAALNDILYAQRRAPSNSLVTLLVGDIRLYLGIPEAVEPFELLARRSGWNGSSYRLAYAHLRNGRAELAAGELHGTLSRNAPLTDMASLAMADTIARETAAIGWCGASNSGHLFLGGRAAAAALADLSVVLDGRRISLKQSRGRTRAALRRFDLGSALWQGRMLEVAVKGVPLIGSPIHLHAVARSEGFVDRSDGAITGWHWLPGEPGFKPTVEVARVSERAPLARQVAADLVVSKETMQSLAWQRRFHFSADELPPGMLAVRDMRGANLYGSPLNPHGARSSGMAAAARLAARFPASAGLSSKLDDEACEISVSAFHRGKRSAAEPDEAEQRQVLVAIPVYRGFETTMQCIRSVLSHRTTERLLVISDNSPDTALVCELEAMARANLIELRQEATNRGFPATANVALREAATAGLDVVLLNSDTLVGSGWLERLRSAAYAAPDIGTATPFSNSATILSYPSRAGGNDIPDPQQVEELADLFFEANGGAVVDIPTGHGFCLYLRHRCLIETGLLREDVFAQGYGEENDFCMRAQHLGWRHVAATGVYVGHAEGQSFAKAKHSLVRRNLRILNALHPGYDRMIAEWEEQDLLAACRRRVDWLRAAHIARGRPAIGLVTHARQGGVLRQVQARARSAEQQGFFSLILQPEQDRQGARGCAVLGLSEMLPNLRFGTDEFQSLAAFLREMKLARIELHHFVGHAPELFAVLASLDLPMEVHLHDYSWMCPRITLTSYNHRYCGEPSPEICAECVSDHGSNIEWNISPRDLAAWSSDLLGRASRIVAPSEDTAARFTRRFDVTPTIAAWEPEDGMTELRSIPAMEPGHVRKICIAGAIGFEKGYEVILGCARHAAAQDIPLSFHIVGFTCDDARLLKTGKVTITGRYEECEAVSMIRSQEAEFAFLPALWPETWSFVLSQLWEAGLPVVAFDIGAQAERIRRTRAGLLLPINLPIPKLVNALCRVSSG